MAAVCRRATRSVCSGDFSSSSGLGGGVSARLAGYPPGPRRSGTPGWRTPWREHQWSFPQFVRCEFCFYPLPWTVGDLDARHPLKCECRYTHSLAYTATNTKLLLVILLGLPAVVGGQTLTADLTGQQLLTSPRWELLYSREDGSGAVVVEDKTTGVRSLLMKRLRREGVDSVGNWFIAAYQGIPPLPLHSPPHHVLIVGLGTEVVVPLRM